MDPGLLLSKALALPFGIATGVGTVVLLLEFILVLVVLVLLVATVEFEGKLAPAAAGCPLVKESDSSPRCKLSGSDSRCVLLVAVPIFREGSVPTFPTD